MSSFNNPTVLGGLPDVQRGDRIWAYLILEGQQPDSTETEQAFTFLANPESLEWGRQAVWNEAITAGTSVQSQQYYHTKGRQWQFRDLLLDTWHRGKSIKPLLEKLQALMVPDAANKFYHPKVLSFVWGAQRLGPCVLTDLKVGEGAWLNGEPASARIDLTLLEIPPPDTNPATRITRPTEEEGSTTPLTERQREEARAEARKWLEANVRSLPQSLQDRIRANRYRFSTDAATGNVTITDEGGQAIGIVGSWNGREFDTSGATIPKT